MFGFSYLIGDPALRAKCRRFADIAGTVALILIALAVSFVTGYLLGMTFGR